MVYLEFIDSKWRIIDKRKFYICISMIVNTKNSQKMEIFYGLTIANVYITENENILRANYSKRITSKKRIYVGICNSSSFIIFTGNMWGQSWENIYDIVKPFNATIPTLDDILEDNVSIYTYYWHNLYKSLISSARM